MAWNSSCSARFWSERRWNTFSHGSLMFSPSRMTRLYLPKTVMTATVDCGTLRNHENRKNRAMTTTTRNPTVPMMLSSYRPVTRRPISTARKPGSPQFMMKTLKPCWMRVSMSLSVAG
jgi:hypothetical protein